MYNASNFAHVTPCAAETHNTRSSEAPTWDGPLAMTLPALLKDPDTAIIRSGLFRGDIRARNIGPAETAAHPFTALHG